MYVNFLENYALAQGLKAVQSILVCSEGRGQQAREKKLMIKIGLGV
jgi:hypothetical protein